MIEFTPGTKIGHIDIYGAQQFTDAYISEIQRRTALLNMQRNILKRCFRRKKSHLRILFRARRLWQQFFRLT